METKKFDLDKESNELFYKNLLNIWEITPASVKEKFLKEQNCVLCKSCSAYISDLQAEIRADKAAKLALLEGKDS